MNLHRIADLLAWLVNNDHQWVVLVFTTMIALGIAYLVWS
jgi:hypothetical protein